MMWTTDLGSVARTKNHPRSAEALFTYARAEFAEADVAWFLAEMSRVAERPKAKRRRSSKRTPTLGNTVRATLRRWAKAVRATG